jgi:hypothetical protein
MNSYNIAGRNDGEKYVIGRKHLHLIINIKNLIKFYWEDIERYCDSEHCIRSSVQMAIEHSKETIKK